MTEARRIELMAEIQKLLNEPDLDGTKFGTHGKKLLQDHMDELAGAGQRLTIEQWKQTNRITSEEEFVDMMQEMSMEGIAEALCSEGCEVEPDGTCPHGHPSILLEAGVI